MGNASCDYIKNAYTRVRLGRGIQDEPLGFFWFFFFLYDKIIKINF